MIKLINSTGNLDPHLLCDKCQTPINRIQDSILCSTLGQDSTVLLHTDKRCHMEYLEESKGMTVLDSSLLEVIEGMIDDQGEN